LQVAEGQTRPPQPATRLAAIAAGLGYRLHEAGLSVTPERSRTFARAVALAEPSELSELYWLGRVTLLSSQGDAHLYDAVFRQVFRGIVDLGELTGSVELQEQEIAPTEPGVDDAATKPPGMNEEIAGTPGQTQQTPAEAADAGADPASVLAAVSQREHLNDREFSVVTKEELALIQRLVEQLPVVPPKRTARRTRVDRGGRRMDIRSTLRRAHRTGGDPVAWTRRSPTTKPRRIVLIADVSGSMEPYARVYLHLMRGAVVSLGAEAFSFATRLTRLTRALQIADADTAYRKVSVEATDWASGTRIGASMKDFLDLHGRRGMARGAIIVIVSDGWELGDTSDLGQSMERLSRLAHHVIWVNPRKASTDYQPLVGGMAAALPHVDTFVSGHSVSALQDVLTAIAGARRRTSRQVA